VKVFDADKTRMIGLSYGEKNCDNTLSRFHTILEQDEQTDRQQREMMRFMAERQQVVVASMQPKLAVASGEECTHCSVNGA